MRRFRLLLWVPVLIAATIPLDVAAFEPSAAYLAQCVERFQAEGTLDLGDARLAAARPRGRSTSATPGSPRRG